MSPTTASKTHLTTPEVARALGVEVWQARRAVDALGEAVPRAGLYRLVPLTLLDRVRQEAARRGYLHDQEGADHA
jgi:hypothetical protein